MHNAAVMYIPCIKCAKPADLQETKPDRIRVFKCRNKKCGEVFTQTFEQQQQQIQQHRQQQSMPPGPPGRSS